MRRLVAVLAGALLALPSSALADDGGGADKGASERAAAAALQTLVGQLLAPDRNMRRAAARSIDTLGPSAVPAMGVELAKERRAAPPADVVALLCRLPAPRSAAGGGGGRVEALLETPPEEGGPAYAEATVTLCLVRALAHVGTPEAVATFAPVALDAKGAFAPDVQRYLAELGERATAGLVLMSHARSAAAEKWASTELEALGKRTPGDAVQTKSKEVLADVLSAYGAVADPDALPVVMSFINADRRLVRDAARDAIASYGEVAVPKLREAYGLLVGEAPPPEWPPPMLRRKLFEVLDKVRLEDVDARVHAGLVLAEAGKFEDAVAAFDDVLARQPDWDKKAELVPAYVFYGQSLLDRDPGRARDVLGKALRLDPSGPRAGQIESALLVLEGKELLRRGIRDPEPFQRALSLDPANVAASEEMLRLEDEARARKRTWDRRVMAGGGVLLFVSALILFVGRSGKRS